jgi:hypothetical protein
LFDDFQRVQHNQSLASGGDPVNRAARPVRGVFSFLQVVRVAQLYARLRGSSRRHSSLCDEFHLTGTQHQPRQ